MRLFQKKEPHFFIILFLNKDFFSIIELLVNYNFVL